MQLRTQVLLVLVLALTPALLPATAMSQARMDDRRQHERDLMVDGIIEMLAETRGYTRVAGLSPAVEAALRRVPRHLFVNADQSASAYANHPLPIGSGQTISQPYMVALMTELLGLQSSHHVLEIGTGSGYQAAVLAELAGHVDSIEIIAPLAQSAAARLERLGYHNVEVHTGDGWHGVPAAAPFEGIIVTAVIAAPPPALLDQLRPGGRMVIPIGTETGAQHLMLVEKSASGEISETHVLPVRFVPFTRER